MPVAFSTALPAMATMTRPAKAGEMDSSLMARADDDDEPEHEQRVGEDGADDGALRDDELALLKREDDDEQLGEVAERRLQHAGDAGAESLAELLGAERDDPRETGEGDGGER